MRHPSLAHPARPLHGDAVAAPDARRRALTFAACLLPLAACKPSPTFHGIDLTLVSYARDFALQGSDGRPHRLADFRGKVVMMFFGFTQCPDVCPTALARAAAVHQMLGEAAKDFQVLFVTIDPERDTAPVLAAYTAAFHPSFLGLYSDLEGTAAVAKEFKVYYGKVPTGSSYTMDHSTLSTVFDRQGKARLAIKHEMSATDVAEDVRQLLDT
ncbi:SCO family protein [Roseateles chitinivorans]|uniref:SCO family protein n=1 Tax=Roseateles chitinivorans TaxID=2917965 RepID=UPI003D67CBDC